MASNSITFYFEIFLEDSTLEDVKHVMLTQDYLSSIYPSAQLLTDRDMFKKIWLHPELSMYSHIFVTQKIQSKKDNEYILCDAIWIEGPGLVWGGVAKIVLSTKHEGVLVQVQESYFKHFFTKIDSDGFKRDSEWGI